MQVAKSFVKKNKIHFLIREGFELRLLEELNADELYALTDKNRKYLREWLPWLDSIKTKEDTLAFIRSTQEQYARNDGFVTALWLDQQIVGVIGFHFIDWDKLETSIGYWLAENAQSKGLITQACQCITDYAFRELKLSKIEIGCAIENIRSRLVPERLGYKQEMIRKNNEWLYDHFVVHVIYSMSAESWLLKK